MAKMEPLKLKGVKETNEPLENYKIINKEIDDYLKGKNYRATLQSLFCHYDSALMHRNNDLTMTIVVALLTSSVTLICAFAQVALAGMILAVMMEVFAIFMLLHSLFDEKDYRNAFALHVIQYKLTQYDQRVTKPMEQFSNMHELSAIV